MVNNRTVKMFVMPEDLRKTVIFVGRQFAQIGHTPFPNDLQEEIADVDALPDAEYREWALRANATFALNMTMLIVLAPEDEEDLNSGASATLKYFTQTFAEVGERAEAFVQQVGENVQ